MIRRDKFMSSRRPYAISLDDFDPVTREYPGGRLFTDAPMPAVWFRRRHGDVVACVGRLKESVHGTPPTDVEDFLSRCTDGRYGGECLGRWDGDGYWGSEIPATRDAHMALLVPMLENYPATPAGFDGWWSFR